MAQPLTLQQLEQFPPRKYKIVRGELQTGDLIFCSGNYFFSKLIQKFTKSIWSHVGVIYRDENLDRVLILESEKVYGVRFAPLSKYLKDYHGKNKPYKGKIVAARITPEIPYQQSYKAISFGMDALTKPYNTLEVFRIAIRTIFKITKHKKSQSYLCSELVQECYKQAGIRFKEENTFISPEGIWRDNHVEMLYRLL